MSYTVKFSKINAALTFTALFDNTNDTIATVSNYGLMVFNKELSNDDKVNIALYFDNELQDYCFAAHNGNFIECTVCDDRYIIVEGNNDGLSGIMGASMKCYNDCDNVTIHCFDNNLDAMQYMLSAQTKMLVNRFNQFG